MSTIELERTETTVRSPADVLNAAADLIEEKGWSQFNYQGANGGFCIMGALVDAGYGLPADAWSDIYDTLDLFVPSTMSLPSWNDKPERTAAEVVSVLREAADRA